MPTPYDDVLRLNKIWMELTKLSSELRRIRYDPTLSSEQDRLLTRFLALHRERNEIVKRAIEAMS